jgi:type I restriction enzyme M protein
MDSNIGWFLVWYCIFLAIGWVVNQVDKYFKGSSGQIELYPKDIANFYIPLVNDEIQKTIAGKIKASFKLKAESKQLLDLAKLAVEMAIEQNEEAALEYINSQTKELNHA